MPIRACVAHAATICLFLSTTQIAQSAEPAGAIAFGREGTVKARVFSTAAAELLAGQGAEIVANYGGFVVIEAPPALLTGQDVEILTEENLVLLNAGHIDTTTPAARQLRVARA